LIQREDECPLQSVVTYHLMGWKRSLKLGGSRVGGDQALFEVERAEQNFLYFREIQMKHGNMTRVQNLPHIQKALSKLTDEIP
jgi:hypothetical protein